MNYISIANIAYLNGKTLLESSYSNGKVLTVKENKIFFDSPDIKKNQLWEILLVEGKILLKNGYSYICYIPDGNSKIELVSENDVEDISFCEWEIGINGEIYRNDDKEEKYLWVADDNMYVISDGYLADRWKIYDEMSPSIQKETNGKYIFTAIIVLLLLIIVKIIYDKSRD